MGTANDRQEKRDMVALVMGKYRKERVLERDIKTVGHTAWSTVCLCPMLRLTRK
jgi:hypothetical protein